jgi:hypothetical protein
MNSPKNTLNLIGQRFGKLLVIERAGSTEKGNSLWLCRCECGNEKVYAGTWLKNGSITSCGCGKQEQIDNAKKMLSTKHTIDNVQVPLVTKKVRTDSTTGHKGIVRKIKRGKERFEAYITVDKKRKYIGSSTDINKAIELRKEAEQKYYGDVIKKYNERMDKHMTHAEQSIKKIKAVLDSDLTAYRIAKEVGYASANPIHDLRKGKADINSMKISTAIEFEKLYKKLH